MGQRFFENYSELEFNILYSFLQEVKSNKNSSEWSKEKAEKIINKIDTYYSVNTIQNDDSAEKYISIGWFGEELRDLVSLIICNVLICNEIQKYFDKFIAEKEKLMEDPDYYKKIQLKHFSPNAMFLSDEDTILLGKTRSILKCLDEKTDKLELICSDFPSRCWTAGRLLKTKGTVYDVSQTQNGWSVYKLYYDKKHDEKIKCVYKLNNETLEVFKEDLEFKEDDENFFEAMSR